MIKLYKEYKRLKAQGARVKPIWRIILGLCIYPIYWLADKFVRLCDDYL